MNHYQQTLYTSLKYLTQNGDTFYSQEFSIDGIFYEIFNYRLASYTEFLLPGALECRGTMFEVDLNGQPVRLASLPMPKFFNLNENPSTMNLDLSKIIEFQEKLDGSIISSYIHKGKLRLKSKGALFSIQAIDAMDWLYLPENQEFVKELTTAAHTSLTINLEFCGPSNRIVVGYENPDLTVLNMRDMLTGQYIDPKQCTWTNEIQKRFVKSIKVDDPAKFIESISDMTGVEGYVAVFEDQFRCKIKGEWYKSLHLLFSNLQSPRHLFEAVLSEGIDDIKSSFRNDILLMKKVEDMEIFTTKLYNSLVSNVETFYRAYKQLSKKEYAILGQQKLDKHAFRLAIELYIGRPINYKQYLSNHYKDFGIKEEIFSTEDSTF